MKLHCAAHGEKKRSPADEWPLARFLREVTIDARPEPTSWGRCIEPWQQELVDRLAPAFEQMAGHRQDYVGPRSFYFVLPRGHDKTGLIGRLCNWTLACARRPIVACGAAADLQQAGLLLESMKAELRLNPWIGGLAPHAEWISGPGGRLTILAADAASASGLKADLIVCDELTFWSNRELFDVLFSGREKRPDSVFTIITNAGWKNSWQHQLLVQAREDVAHWSVYEAPLGATLAGWMSPERIEALRAMLPVKHAQRVFDNHWIDTADDPLLPFDLIAACQADCLWPAGAVPRTRHELYLGVDIGRTRDKSVIWTFELIGDVLWTREIAVFAQLSFDRQKQEIVGRMSRDVAALRIDRGGIGMQLSEELENEFPDRVRGVQLGSGRQGQMALALAAAFESRRIRIPHDRELVTDLQLVSQVGERNGQPVLLTDRDATGHGDRFWAAALALHGVPLVVQRPSQGLPQARTSRFL